MNTSRHRKFHEPQYQPHRGTSRQHAVRDDAELHLGLTNSYYEQAHRPADQESEFTATEERIIELITDGLNETLPGVI